MSEYPVDQLIVELVDTGRNATAGEVKQIIERMATAPFDPRIVPVQIQHRGLSYRGTRLGARAQSLTYHLVKRVLDDRQWAYGTTEDDYLDDVRRAVRSPAARLTVYERRGGYIAAAVVPTDSVLPLERRGARPFPLLLVVYSADRGIMLTGYQITGLAETGVPREALWLS